MIPLTYAVTLADWTPQQDMLRMMLRCLGDQTCQDFDVILADHHYDARKSSVDELSKNYKFKIHHIPIIPAPHVAKHYIDCSVFNVGWILSDAERCIRYSEWRLCKPELTEILLKKPADLFVDLGYHDIPEDDVWDRESGEINWSRVPTYKLENELHDTVPSNCYANNTISREKWIQVNGFNEVDFNFFHWEDIDYCGRCQNSGFRAERIYNMMYRIRHGYGNLPNRSVRMPERLFKPICPKCDALINYIRYYVGSVTHRQWGDFFKARGSHIEIIRRKGRVWLVCKECNFVLPYIGTEDICNFVTKDKSYTKAPIGVSGSGRNMEILSADLAGKSMQDKLEIYKDSWTNERYLQFS